jgi:uncharacterized RDD family membrane protein YckC
MSAAESYIHRVISQLPPAGALREQVAMELRSHIAERVEHGQSVEEAIRQFGDPVKLAESYLAAVPLVPASFWRRAAAKLIDFLMFVAIYAPIAWLLFLTFRGHVFGFLVPELIILFVLTCALYPLLAEYLFGRTVGKRLLGLRVVRESGGRITLGQSAVRQLPVFLQVGWVDILFALFTEHHQRAFELLSKTRVVLAEEKAS